MPTVVKQTRDMHWYGWKQEFWSYNELGADLREEGILIFDGRWEADIYCYNVRKQKTGEEKLYAVKFR
jgi:hypothetical protein